MGVWMIGTGNISIKPQVDEDACKKSGEKYQRWKRRKKK